MALTNNVSLRHKSSGLMVNRRNKQFDRLNEFFQSTS
ncbi:hypothetical protein HDE77_002934 [Rhodanobacter sp. MP7CTX1]|nr:hypothetical protein [Rhodanobacter sp. MP7CTX1]